MRLRLLGHGLLWPAIAACGWAVLKWSDVRDDPFYDDIGLLIVGVASVIGIIVGAVFLAAAMVVDELRPGSATEIAEPTTRTGRVLAELRRNS